jgi:hypothetical protein
MTLMQTRLSSTKDVGLSLGVQFRPSPIPMDKGGSPRIHAGEGVL